MCMQIYTYMYISIYIYAYHNGHLVFAWVIRDICHIVHTCNLLHTRSHIHTPCFAHTHPQSLFANTHTHVYTHLHTSACTLTADMHTPDSHVYLVFGFIHISNSFIYYFVASKCPHYSNVPARRKLANLSSIFVAKVSLFFETAFAKT